VPSKQPVTYVALAWMVAMVLSFVAMVLCVRLLAGAVSSVEQVFLRSLFGLVFMLAVMTRRSGLPRIHTKRLGMHFTRTALTYLGVATWFYALTRMELAEAVAIHFTLPLFGIVFAIIFLKEEVTVDRWIATVVGFAGALVIIRPGVVELEFVAFVVLFSAAAYGAGDIALKKLSETESSAMIVLMLNLIMVPMSLVPALFDWTWPSWDDVPLILLLGLTGVSAHYCLARSMALADASFVIPMEFLRLPALAVAGYWLFNEVPDQWTIAGAAIICGATYYMTRSSGRH
jgi:drug/metabolite transporter (DMT)-like permease